MKKVTKIERIADTGIQKRKKRVAAYCRVSTSSDAQLESLEAQKSHYEKYILSREDWEFAGLYYEIIILILIQRIEKLKSMPLRCKTLLAV